MLSHAAVAAGEPLTFRWPVPGRVTITETIRSNELQAKLRYQAALAVDGDQVTVRLEKIQVLAAQARGARTAAARKQVEAALRGAAVLPTIVVDRQGVFRDIADVDRAIEAMRKAAGARDRRAQQAMGTPAEMQQALRQRSAAVWNLWVGFWAGQNLEPGQSVQRGGGASLGDGRREQPLTLTHRGIDGPPGHVALTFQSHVDSETHAEEMRGLIDALLAQAGPPGKPASRALIERLGFLNSGLVLTDPSTLRPARAESRREVVLKLKGQPPQTELELHSYEFSWP